jgi:hypothetical protein
LRPELLESRLALATLAIGDASGLEGSPPHRTLSFPVSLSAPSNVPVSVRYTTVNGTATAPKDYSSASGTLVFAPGETERLIDVRINGDFQMEKDEVFAVRLSKPSGAKIVDPQATGTIVNDDPHYLVDDFADGNDSGWTQIDFTGQGTFDASSRAYRLRTAGELPPDDPSVGTMAATFEPARNDQMFGNGIIRGTVRANSQGTTAGYLLRANTNPNEDHDYGFFGSSSFGTFYIERFDLNAGGQTIIAMADPSRHPFVAGVDYRIEAGVWGEWIWMKGWRVGTPRPLLPQLVVRDSTFGPEDGTQLNVIAFFDPAAVTEPVRVDATFDDITFTPLPAVLGHHSAAAHDSFWIGDSAADSGRLREEWLRRDSGASGERNLADDIGQRLWHEHDEDGLIERTLSANKRRRQGGDADRFSVVDVLFSELLTSRP